MRLQSPLLFSNENQEKKGPWLSQRSREHRQCLSILLCLSSVSSGDITESCPFYCFKDLTLFVRFKVMVIVVLWVLGLFLFENLQLSDLAGIENPCSFEVPAARARAGVQMMNHETLVFQPSRSGYCEVSFQEVVLGDEMQLERSQVISAFS